MAPVRKAHVHGYVTISAVSANDSADFAAPLFDPVALAHPHLRAHTYFFWLHDASPPTQRLNNKEYLVKIK
jgi:hypothetical protein